MSDLLYPSWGPFYGDPISCCLLVALWAYAAWSIGWRDLPALSVRLLDWWEAR